MKIMNKQNNTQNSAPAVRCSEWLGFTGLRLVQYSLLLCWFATICNSISLILTANKISKARSDLVELQTKLQSISPTQSFSVGSISPTGGVDTRNAMNGHTDHVEFQAQDGRHPSRSDSLVAAVDSALGTNFSYSVKPNDQAQRPTAVR